MDRIAVGRRQARRGALQQMLALRIGEQYRTQRAGILGVDHQADGGEDVVQLMIGRNHTEYVALRLGKRHAVIARAGGVHGDS